MNKPLKRKALPGPGTPKMPPKGKAPAPPTRQPRKKKRQAFYVARAGRVKVPVYRRQTPSGYWNYMVANYAGEKRRFDSYPTEPEAIEAADKLARRLSARDVVSANLTEDQAIEYASSLEALVPYGLTVREACSKVAEMMKEFHSLAVVNLALAFYRQHHRPVTKKRVPEIVDELRALKEKRGASADYLRDLRYRLTAFAGDFNVDASDVTTPDVQQWLDHLGLGAQSYKNFRTVLCTLFAYAQTRNYCSSNPVLNVEAVKVKRGAIAIYTPTEIARLLASAAMEFVPALALGAFAGLRTAEILRLEWIDVDLAGRQIVVGADRAKTATRRVVPISDNLASWLADHVKAKGKVWALASHALYWAQRDTAKATEIKADAGQGIKAMAAVVWKNNALRHSYASYRFAQIQDAGRVAAEMGNSPQMVFKHYRELVKSKTAEAWFNVKPEAQPANVVQIPAQA